MPNIPSAGESGVPGLNIAGWLGFYAPKGRPADVVAKLNAAMVQALADPQVKARFAQLGLDVAAVRRHGAARRSAQFRRL
jgi:tripartite-type tricarboxylate transporter receptor subunit TctC